MMARWWWPKTKRTGTSPPTSCSQRREKTPKAGAGVTIASTKSLPAPPPSPRPTPCCGLVAQGSIQWSVVYNYSQQTIQAVMGQRYDAVHTFSLDK